MTDASLYARLARSFARFADRTCVEEEGARVWSYADIERMAGRLATRLQALGLAPGERLLVQAEKSVEALVLYIACLRAGAIYLPLNNDYTEAELNYFVGDAEPKLAVCRPQSVALFERIGGGALAIRTIEQLFADLPEELAPPVARSPDDSPRSSTPPAPPASPRARC